jgi:hypothetical protein
VKVSSYCVSIRRDPTLGEEIIEIDASAPVLPTLRRGSRPRPPLLPITPANGRLAPQPPPGWIVPPPSQLEPSGSPNLQEDYHIQLILQEQMNKRNVLMAQQEQDSINLCGVAPSHDFPHINNSLSPNVDELGGSTQREMRVFKKQLDYNQAASDLS